MAKRENVVRLTDAERDLICFVRDNASRLASVETSLLVHADDLLKQGDAWKKREKDEWADDYYDKAAFVRTFFDLFVAAKLSGGDSR